MVYNIVTRNHGGRISIDTQEGAGATFHLYLQKAAPPVPVTLEKPADVPHGLETILIVEDEDAVRKVAERVLHKYGYSTISAADGDEGLSVFRERRAEIDLVLLDLTMPKLSGSMLLDEIIAIDPEAKVVISSGQSEEDLKKISRARGYIAKPYRSDDLAKAIRAALDG
jgi:CheY-like chemotaxis protein